MAVTQTTGVTRATARYLHVSPYKIRQVLQLVRGLPVEDAERVLQLCEKDAAEHVSKVLRSATANAEHNLSMEADELYIALAWADEGPTRKSGRPRARGRYFRIRKRTTHLTIVLDRYDVEEMQERRRREEAAGRGAAVAQRSRAERVRRSRAAAGGAVAEEAADEEAATAADDEATTTDAGTEVTSAEATETAPTADAGDADETPDGGSTEAGDDTAEEEK